MSALCIIILLVHLFSLYNAKTRHNELKTLLLAQHDEHMQAVQNLDAKVSAIDKAVAAGFEHNGYALRGLESGQRSLSGRLSTMNGHLSSDLAAVSRGQAALAAALKETGIRSQDPKDDLFVQSLFRKGQEYFADERYAQAAVSMADVLSLAPDYHEARLIHAVAWYRENPLDSGRREEIRADLAALVSRDPHNILALETLGSMALEEQDWRRARQYYQRLIGLDGRNIEYSRMFVVACRAEGAVEEAEEEITLLLQDDPGNPRYLLYRGEALEKQGEYGQAFTFYEASYRRDPAYLPALLGAARTAVQTGNYLRAGELLSSPSVPKNHTICNLLAECSKNLGDGENAITWWEKAAASLTLNTPEDTKKACACYVRIARYSFEAADYEGALEAAGKGLRLAGNPELHLIKAKALLETGRTAQAKEELSLVVQSEADLLLNEEARKLLESLEGDDG